MKCNHRKRRTLGATLVLALIGSLSGAVWARNAQACQALRNHVMDRAYVTSARVMTSDTLVEYCEVRAIARPSISIEVRLPLNEWNRKLYQVGCGGFCGILGGADRKKRFVKAMGPGLARGYATATSDSGHHGLGITDAGWAYNDPPAERDWGWHTISGIIVGAPAINTTGLVAIMMSWLVQANTDYNGETILKPGKDGLIGVEVIKQWIPRTGPKTAPLRTHASAPSTCPC